MKKEKDKIDTFTFRRTSPALRAPFAQFSQINNIAASSNRRI